MTGSTLRFPITAIEGLHLASLMDDFIELLTESSPSTDPGIDRLVPDAYPDDAEASQDFATSTRRELLDRRVADATIVRSTLEPFMQHPAPTDTDALCEEDLLIPTDQIDAWLRTLTALRLVIATRLGIVEDDNARDPEDQRFDIFDWLGYRLDGLITAADELMED